MGNRNLNSKEEYEIATEKSRYDDILLLPIFDSYGTLTNKVQTIYNICDNLDVNTGAQKHCVCTEAPQVLNPFKLFGFGFYLFFCIIFWRQFQGFCLLLLLLQGLTFS